MTKKDYELIAKVINDTNNKNILYSDLNDFVRILVIKFCFSLGENNPRFNPDKFIKACGLKNKTG